MRISRSKIRKTLGELRRRNEREKGIQPELTLGCFYDLGEREDSICRKCRHYRGCEGTLRAYEIKKLFRR